MKLIDTVQSRIDNWAVSRLEQRGAFTNVGDISEYAKLRLESLGASNSSGVAVDEESALTLSYCTACIKVLAETTAHVPLQLLQTSVGTRVAQQVTDHPLHWLLGYQPNFNMTSFTFRETLEAHRNGWGNAYAWIKRPNFMSNQTDELVILPPTTRPRKLKDGSIVYETVLDGSNERIPGLDVLHIPGLSMDGFVGYSPITLLREALGLGMSAQQFGATLFKNGAMPRMIFESAQSTANKKEFRDKVDETYSGMQNAHRSMVLPRGVTAKMMQVNPDDAQFLETRKFNRTEVAGFYRVAPHLIGDLERSTFTNSVEMDLAFIKHTMVSVYTRWEGELNRKLLTKKERLAGLHFKFNVMGILRGAPETRAKVHDYALKGGWKNQNEVRADEDLEEMEGLDVFYMPINSVPVGTELGAAPESQRPAESNSAPVVNDMLTRVCSAATKGLKKAGEDPTQAAAFLKNHKRHVKIMAGPVFQMFQRTEQELDTFIERHVECILGDTGDTMQQAVPLITTERLLTIFTEVTTDEQK